MTGCVSTTTPHSEGTALDAARAADLILVPYQRLLTPGERSVNPTE